MANKIFITSGKGGVGKSTICALLGVALTRLNKKTLIIEMDFGLRSLDVMLGVDDKTVFDLSDVLMSRCEIDKAIIDCKYELELKLISAPLDSFLSYNKESLKNLFDKIDDNYDYILIDSPAGLGQSFRDAIGLVDSALIVVTPDIVCVRDGRKVSDILLNFGITDQRLVINKVKNKFTKLDILPDLDYVIDAVGVQLISVIPESIEIFQKTLVGADLGKESSNFKIFDNLAKRIMGKSVSLMIR